MSDASHFKFNELQKTAVINAIVNKQNVTKYIEVTNQKIFELAKKANQLEEQLTDIKNRMSQLTDETLKAKQQADDQYKQTVHLVVQQLIDSKQTPEPPWKAELEFSDGIPIGINLVPQTENTGT